MACRFRFATVMVILFGARLVFSTSDMNIHQLQLVADHLTNEECERLEAALRQEEFQLNETTLELDLSLQQTGVDSEKILCISRLLLWDRTLGKDKTFIDLAVRLEQIGRKDLSDKLSDAVYGEEIDVLEKKFLDDPFEKKIPKDSVLLVTDKKAKKRKKVKSGKRWTNWEITRLVLVIVALLSVLFFVFVKIFGDLMMAIFRAHAPDFLVKWLDMVSGECTWYCKKTKNIYETTVIGMKKKKTPDRQAVMEMNKNLNNYLNGHHKDAFYYFPDVYS